MANSALKCRKIIVITARSFYNYNNVLINFGQLYSNSCYTTLSIATLGMCIACESHQLWAVRPCIYHIFRHLAKWLIFCRTGHANTVQWRVCDHTTWFWRCLRMAFGHPLSFGLSQFHGHGSWIVCKAARVTFTPGWHLTLYYWNSIEIGGEWPGAWGRGWPSWLVTVDASGYLCCGGRRIKII